MNQANSQEAKVTKGPKESAIAGLSKMLHKEINDVGSRNNAYQTLIIYYGERMKFFFCEQLGRIF